METPCDKPVEEVANAPFFQALPWRLCTPRRWSDTNSLSYRHFAHEDDRPARFRERTYCGTRDVFCQCPRLEGDPLISKVLQPLSARFEERNLHAFGSGG